MMRRLLALLTAIALTVPLMINGWGNTEEASAGAFDIFNEEGGRKVRQLDPAGDADFSQACVVDDRDPNHSYLGEPAIPHTGQSAANCANPLPQADITEYSLRFIPKTSAEALKNPYNTTQGVSTLEAKWTFGGNWPTKGTLAPVLAGADVVTGLSADIRFRNPYLQINDLWPVCDTTRATTSNPTKRPSRPGTDHYLDQHYWFVSLNYNLDATDGWDGLIQVGHYGAWADDGFGHVIVDFEGEPPYNKLPGGPTDEKGLGVAYDYNVSGKTITVKVPTTVITEEGVCLKTHDGTANNNLNAGHAAVGGNRDLETTTGIDLPDEPGQIGANRGTVGGKWYEPFALSASDRANAPASVVSPNTRFAYPAGGPGGHDRLVDIAAESGVSFLIGTPEPIPTGAVTGPTVCKVLDGEPAFDIDGDGKNDNPGGPIRCAGALSEGGTLQWLLSGSSTVDRSSLADGSPTYRPSFGGAFTPLLTTGLYGGTGCVNAGKPATGVGTPGLVGMSSFGVAGMAQPRVQNPLVRPGQACATLNPLGSRYYSVPGAEISISD